MKNRTAPLKILLVSWEYPPVVVGGLGRHVHHIATSLARLGHEVVVLSRNETGSDSITSPTSNTVVDGVRIIAAAEDPPHFDFGTAMMPWTLAMGHSMIRAGLTLASGAHSWTPDVVHAHDWLVAHPAIALADFFDVPLVSTIHATEAGRHSGWVAGEINRQVHSVEWWLARESDALITCSASMHDEVNRLFGPDLAHIHTLHNGIDVSAWPYKTRKKRSGPPRLLFVGRLEYEKGVQDAIAALPHIRKLHPGTTLTIAGTGTQQEWLTELTVKHDITEAITFRGALAHQELLQEMYSCDAVVLPSRYEPFGIVALEAAAAGAPLVTSTAGGLGEAVTDQETGLSFAPADIAGLVAAVHGVLADPAATALRTEKARARLTQEFSWNLIAQRTAAVYAGATRRPRKAIGRPIIPVRPLPERDPGKPVT